MGWYKCHYRIINIYKCVQMYISNTAVNRGLELYLHSIYPTFMRVCIHFSYLDIVIECLDVKDSTNNNIDKNKRKCECKHESHLMWLCVHHIGTLARIFDQMGADCGFSFPKCQIFQGLIWATMWDSFFFGVERCCPRCNFQCTWRILSHKNSKNVRYTQALL